MRPSYRNLPTLLSLSLRLIDRIGVCYCGERMFQNIPKRFLAASMAVALATCTFGCADEDDGGIDNSYENQVKLTCNGNVLVDRTFTSREACEAFRDANTFECAGIELSVNC